MEGKDKNSKTDLSGYLKYREDSLSNSDRHDFEREIQKDPFALEAEEGLSSLDNPSLRDDMVSLKARLRARMAKTRNYAVYRIAASLAVLLVLTTVFILLQRSDPQPVKSALQKDENTPVLEKSKDQEDITEEKVAIAMAPAAQEEKPVQEPKDINRDKSTETGYRDQQRVKEVSRMEGIEEIRPNRAAEAEQVLTVPAAASVIEKETKKVSGRIISTEDNLPLPGASISVKGSTMGTITDSEGRFDIEMPDTLKRTLVASYIGMKSMEISAAADTFVQVNMDADVSALQEVVVTGYGVSRKALSQTGAVSHLQLEKADTYTEFIEAEPLKGREEFNSYIMQNIRIPEDLQESERVVVVVSFTVRTTGTIHNIKAIRSPGQSFTNEAVRLIREGPEWKAATENGKPVESEARVRIVFRY